MTIRQVTSGRRPWTCCATLAASIVVITAVADVSWAEELRITDAQASLVVDLEISAEVAGRVEQVLVREGDQVQPGQIVVQLDSKRANSELARADQDLMVAQVQSENDVDRQYAEKALAVQQSELTRSQLANTQYENSVSLTEMKRLELMTEQSRLAIEKADRDLRIAAANQRLKAAERSIAALNLELHAVRCMDAGIVVNIAVQPGEWIELGKPVVRVVRLDVLRIEAFVAASQPNVGNLNGRATQFVLEELRDGGNEAAAKLRTYAGKVVFVSPEVNPVTHQCRIWAEVANVDGWLRPGMRGTLSIDDGQ